MQTFAAHCCKSAALASLLQKLQDGARDFPAGRYINYDYLSTCLICTWFFLFCVVDLF